MIEQMSTFIRRGFFTPIRELDPQPRNTFMLRAGRTMVVVGVWLACIRVLLMVV
jgi:hypothetical protein